MAQLEIFLCGEPGVRYDGKPWTVRLSGTAWVLLTLLVTSERPSFRELLAASIWPEYDRAEALANLRRHLHSVVQALPQTPQPWIVAARKTVQWNPAAPVRVDVVEFERALAAGRFRDAVDGYRGELLPNSLESSVVAERERLRIAYENALRRLLAEARATRDLPAAIGFAERLLALDEWNEDAVREWMAAKYAAGDVSAALAMHERLAARLRKDFDAEPAEATQELRDLIAGGLPLPAVSDSVDRFATDPTIRRWHHPFVGREEPLERILALWKRTTRGSGGVAFVSGEAGIGKSRLASEVAAHVRESGGRVLFGTTPDPESEPYAAVLTALRSALDPSLAQIGDDRLAALARAVPEMYGLREGLVAAPESTSDGARETFFDAVVRAFEHLCRKQPTCIVLEDLHWAGNGTLDLIGAIARRAGTLPLAIVATYRCDADPKERGVDGLALRLVRERRAIAHALPPLDAAQTARIVDAAIGDAPRDLHDAVVSACAGNPLFVGQLVAGYLETGESAAMPGDVAQAIAARFRSLDPQVRIVAEMAAIAGESFRADLVASAGGWDENGVLDALAILTERGLVRESGGPLEFVFAHALFASTLYTESQPGTRAARHRRIATLLERDSVDGHGAAASIAYHWKQAGEAARAASAYLRAAERAAAIYAYGDALAFCTSALDLGRAREVRRAGLLLRESIYARRARHDEQRADLDELNAIASEDGDESLRWEVLRRRAGIARSLEDPAEERMLAELLERAVDSLEPRRIAEAKRLIATRLFATADPAGARATALEAAGAFERLGDEQSLVEVFALLARIEAQQGDAAATSAWLERARATGNVDRFAAYNAAIAAAYEANTRQQFSTLLDIGERALELAREVGYVLGQAHANNFIGIAGTRLGAFRRALDALEAARAIFEETHSAFGRASVSLNLASLRWRSGEMDAAYEGLDASLRMLVEMRSVTGEILALNNLGNLTRNQGDLEKAVAYGRRALALSREHKQPHNEATAASTIAHALIEFGELDEAQAQALASRDLVRSVERPIDTLEDLAVFVLLRLAQGRHAEARAEADELASAPAGDIANSFWPQFYHFTAARAYHAAGDAAKARKQLDLAAGWVGRIAAQIREAGEDPTSFARLPLNAWIVQARSQGIWPGRRTSAPPVTLKNVP